MRRLVLLACLAMCAVACTPIASAPDLGETAGSPADPSHPVGIAAIGHSGLTGEGTATWFQSSYEHSWATGMSPKVNSVYLRLIADRPETDGVVTNQAVGGSRAAAVPDQARAALHVVPAPALVIIQTIDNDIRCDGTDAENFASVGQAVAEALDVITTASPNSRILVVGLLGRPSATFVEELVAHDPGAKEAFLGGPTPFLAARPPATRQPRDRDRRAPGWP